MASFFNLGQMQDFDSYGEHLFGLGHRLVHFCGEEPDDAQGSKLQTRISSSEKSGNEPKAETLSLLHVGLDSQFQMNFMTEHCFTLQKYIKKYMTLFLKEEDGLITSSTEGQNQIQLTDALALLEGQIQSFTGTKITFSGLFQNQKVLKLLKQILHDFHQKISLTLLKIAMLVWTEYFRLASKNLDEREIIQFSSRLISITFLKKVREMLPINQEEVDLSFLKGFMNVFVNTFLFVAFEYCVNPYYQIEEQQLVKEYQNYELFLYDTSLDDQQVDDEEYQQQNGRKLVKLADTNQTK